MLSEYEKLRAQNIAHNRLHLQELGLVDKETEVKPLKQKKERKLKVVDPLDIRKCERLQNKPPSHRGLDKSYNEDDYDEDGMLIRKRKYRKRNRDSDAVSNFPNLSKEKPKPKPNVDHANIDMQLDFAALLPQVGEYLDSFTTSQYVTPSYKVSGRRAQCKYCQRIFVLKRNRKMRLHSAGNVVCPGSEVE
jgi:hypothetical protein